MRLTIVGMHFFPEPSGNAPYTTRLATGLADRGHDVSVVTGLPHYPEWRVADGYGAWRATSREDGVRVTRLKHVVPHRPTALSRLVMESTFGLRAATQHLAPADVMICVSPALVSTAIVSARRRGREHGPARGLWVQDLYSKGVVETGHGPAVGRVATFLEGAVAKRFDGLAVVHDRFKQLAVGTLGLAPDRIEVIRNWSHVAIPADVDRAGVRARLGWRPEEVVVVHAGNMGAKQGLENVVAAARLADDRASSVRFVLLGGGNQSDLLRRLGAGVDRLHFISSLPTDEFSQVLAAADILLVNEKPGVKEMSVPSKLTSYYATGNPVLAATAPGSVTAGEVALSGAGVRVDPGEPAALLVAAERLGGDREEALRLGRQGRRFLAENLSESTALDHFETWCDTLIAARWGRLEEGHR